MRDDREELRGVAESIARRAGAITECEVHGELLDNDCAEEAYKLGNKLFDTEFRGVFSSRLEMTDAIKEVIDDAGWDCGMCEKNASD
ncbi:hypothetical protein [Pseudomonas baetica]|uniref:hypothetical protein n=1 Tax=Pseudomonas baetica TaxID=674054 RepID=UPI002405DEB8|nr:hypothetical protein [Pseudomonas baetica]MDF9778019.1 hypothetical protein [Pseudomonas baetica]